MTVSVNENAAKAYLRAISGLALSLGLDEEVKLSTLINMEGVLNIEPR